ncbi:MAG: GNAT family N-acetyltransferase [Pseudomonadota bacterium]
MAVSWAREEGWNPGLDDLAAFFAADPNGFFMGFLDGEPVSSISVVRYGLEYGFLGFYIVAPDHRGSGIGIATWNRGIDYLEGRTIGLDGVVDQQDNYRASEFVYAGRNVRYSGLPRGLPNALTARNDEATIVASSDALLPGLNAYDSTFFPHGRAAFLRAWTQPSSNVQRQTWAYLIDGEVLGYVTKRKCAVGYKIGPLLADNEQIAEALLIRAAATLGPNDQLTIDVPDANIEAVRLAKRFGMQPVFETARMYRLAGAQTVPGLPIDRTFGVTTYELG